MEWFVGIGQGSAEKNGRFSLCIGGNAVDLGNIIINLLLGQGPLERRHFIA